METKLLIILLVLFCAFLGATGQVFFKLGSTYLEFNLYSLVTNWRFLLGLVFYAIATILLVYALKYGNLSILYPVIASSYIWVTIFSIIFLGEIFSLYKWVGIFLIILGIIMIVK